MGENGVAAFACQLEWAIAKQEVHVGRWNVPKPLLSFPSPRPNVIALTQRYVYLVFSRDSRIAAHPRNPNEPRMNLSVPTEGLTHIITPNANTERLLLCYADGRIVRLSPPDTRPQLIAQLNGEVKTYAIAGDQLFVCDSGGTVHLILGNTSITHWSIGRTGATQIDVDPSGKYLLSVGLEGVIRVWRIETRRQELATIGHRRGVFAGVFIDTQHILTLGDDLQTLRWNLGQYRQPQARWTSPADRLLALRRAQNKKIYLLTDASVYQLEAEQWRRIVSIQ